MNTKIKYIVALFISAVAFVSCDDYLDQVPEDRESSENYFNSPQDYEDALVGAYDLLGTNYLNHILGEIASDNALAGGENPTDVLDWQQIDDMTHTPDNEELRKVWNWMYGGISRTNYIFEYQDKIDFEGKEEILAQNLFLRSFYYFKLTQFFGDVPLIIGKRLSFEESQSIERTPRNEVWAQLQEDLMAAIPNLPWVQEQPGRITKGAAWALLGKIYLYDEKYDEAARAFNQVINSGQYQLLDDFGTIFLNTNENNAESVFEIQYSIGVEGGSYDALAYVEGNVAVGFMGPEFTGGDYSPYGSTSGRTGNTFSVPVQELVDQYQAGDTRLDATIFDIEAFVAERPDVEYNKRNEYTGYYNKKYIPYDEANLPDVVLTHGNNYRAIRYSDVLLMAAEANLLATTPVNNPQTLLDMVRDRAFGDTNHRVPATLENIWHERRLELAGEGHRFFDQVRTGKTSSIPGFTPGKNELFPIPRIEIELAGNNWEQNPGY